MNKYIIITGAPRAGKSTISHLLAQRFGYHHISMDAIIAGIEAVFPETGANTHEDIPLEAKMKKISGKIAPFIKAMIESGEYGEFDGGVVIDVSPLLPDDYIRHLKQSDVAIYYFVHSEMNQEECFNMLKNHDTPKDYTYYYSDERLRLKVDEIVQMSQILKRACFEYKLPCFEMSKKREEKIKTFLETL